MGWENNIQHAQKRHWYTTSLSGYNRNHALPNQPVFLLPEWNTRPYELDQLTPGLSSRKLQCLSSLLRRQPGIYLASLETTLQRIPPHHFLQTSGLSLTPAFVIEPTTLAQRLSSLGYQPVEQVLLPGEFSLRGETMDLFLLEKPAPYRISWQDDQIEAIETYHRETGRKIQSISQCRIAHRYEFPIDNESIQSFWRALHRTFGHAKTPPRFASLQQGIPPTGLQYWQPLFFERAMGSLFDLLPIRTPILSVGPLSSLLATCCASIQAAYTEHKPLEPDLLPPHYLWCSEETWREKFSQFPSLHTTIAATEPSQHATSPDATKTILLISDPEQIPYAQSKLQAQGIKASRLHRAFPKDLQNHRDAHALYVAPSITGFTYTDHHQVIYRFLPFTELFRRSSTPGHAAKPSNGPSSETANAWNTKGWQLNQLSFGDPIVHLQHGVGRYEGLKMLSIQGKKGEFICIRYAQDAKLYAPVANLHRIRPYGQNARAPLHKLGSEAWQKKKQQAYQSASDMAAILLQHQAKRNVAKGKVYTVQATSYDQFCSSFPHRLTKDQQSAMEAVLQDLAHPSPMDRLVCGEVGFGKTEVALRAAFVTTYQHTQLFSERFEGFSVPVCLLTRFTKRQEQRQIDAWLQEGRPLVLIGTHKLLSSMISSSHAGLLIIDEEHRFGVKQKLLLQQKKETLNVLSLTATPIPRTLHLALSGLKAISLIHTPPQNRYPVKTFSLPQQPGTIVDAVRRELRRGGQIFYIHNHIATIFMCAQHLQNLLPEIRILTAHGKLGEIELENIMLDFYQQKADLLLCTTIIETGIDIPTANTIIIENADQFGLSQLHQLRGRVGRRSEQAYAYLLTKERDTLPTEAKLRLQALCQFQSLGAGFHIASQDLDLRGAGEILGEAQSGQIHELGLPLYTELLEEATRMQQRLPPSAALESEIEIELGLPGSIPEAILPQVSERLYWYQAIATATTEHQLLQLKQQWRETVSTELPETTANLFFIQSLRQLALQAHVQRIKATKQGFLIRIKTPLPFPPEQLIQWTEIQPESYQLLPSEELSLQLPPLTPPSQVQSTLLHLLQALQKMTQEA